jgi:hypothetical protein
VDEKKDVSKVKRVTYLCNLVKSDSYVIDLHGEVGNIWYIICKDNFEYGLHNSGKEISIEKLNSIASSNLVIMSGDICVDRDTSFRVNDKLFVKYIYSRGSITEYELSHIHDGVHELRVRFPFELCAENVVKALTEKITKTVSSCNRIYALKTLSETPLRISDY